MNTTTTTSINAIKSVKSSIAKMTSDLTTSEIRIYENFFTELSDRLEEAHTHITPSYLQDIQKELEVSQHTDSVELAFDGLFMLKRECKKMAIQNKDSIFNLMGWDKF